MQAWGEAVYPLFYILVSSKGNIHILVHCLASSQYILIAIKVIQWGYKNLHFDFSEWSHIVPVPNDLQSNNNFLSTIVYCVFIFCTHSLRTDFNQYKIHKNFVLNILHKSIFHMVVCFSTVIENGSKILWSNLHKNFKSK